MARKDYEREIELYGFLERLQSSDSEALANLARRLRRLLWEVLHTASTPPKSWQEEVIRPSALADLEKGNTFNYCVAELEKFTYEYPLLASALRIAEKIDEIKALG